MNVWIGGLLGLAGLFGAAGVALAAAGAHVTANPSVTIAANFLLFHAGALVALCALAIITSTARWICLAASLIAAGSILFSGDLAVRGLAGFTLVRLAAPTGGVLMIAGWLVAAAALPLALRTKAKKLI